MGPNFAHPAILYAALSVVFIGILAKCPGKSSKPRNNLEFESVNLPTDCSKEFSAPQVKGESVVATNLQQNCDRKEPSEPWVECIFTSVTLKQFEFVIEHKNSTFDITEVDKRVSYDPLDYILMRKGTTCMFQRKARLSILTTWASDKKARFRCDAVFSQGPSKKWCSLPVKLTPVYQTCKPHFVDEATGKVYFGQKLTFQCVADIGTDGELFWVIRQEGDKSRMWSCNSTNPFEPRVLVTNLFHWEDVKRGPWVTSRLDIFKPRLFSGARVACLSKRPAPGHSLDRVVDTPDYPYSISTPPIEVVYPTQIPLIYLKPDLPPNIFVDGTKIKAGCAAVVDDTSYLKWVLQVADKLYAWQVTLYNVTALFHPTDDETNAYKVTLEDAQISQGDLDNSYVFSVLTTRMTKHFNKTIECQHVGIHKGLESITRSVQPIELGYWPQKPKLSLQYEAKGNKLVAELTCSGYIGSNGTLVWTFIQPGQPNLTWYYYIGPKGKVDGSGNIKNIKPFLQLHPPTDYYDDNNGNGLSTRATITLTYLVNNSKVTCRSAAGSYVTDEASEMIYLEGAVSRFQKDWNGGINALRDLGWIFLAIMAVILFIMGFTDMLLMIFPSLAGDLALEESLAKVKGHTAEEKSVDSLGRPSSDITAVKPAIKDHSSI